MTITLKNLHEATPQQVFNQVAGHMLRQGAQSRNQEDRCVYRTKLLNGQVLKCAAGALIGDDEYTIDMDVSDDGTGWKELIERKLVPAAHRELIEDLQAVHDGFVTDDWMKELERVAITHGLMMSWPVAKDIAIIIKHKEAVCF